MGAQIIALRAPQPLVKPVAFRDPFEGLTDAQRAVALERYGKLRPAVEKMQAGVCAKRAAKWLHATHADMPSVQTLERWLAELKTGGLAALATENKGRVRKDYGWEARAIELYNTHSNRTAATVARLLQKEGETSATASRVRTYLAGLPSLLGKHSPARVGQHEHKLSYGRYMPRSTDDLPVGLVYQGDGHKCDAYVADPDTGRPVRLELIAWMDLASRKIVGWWYCEDESSVNVLCSLSHAFTTHDHVPGALHADNGAFKSRLFVDDVSGFYDRFGCRFIRGIPGNPHGHGHIERWWGTYEERFGKNWDTYCGVDAAPEHNRKLTLDVAAGRRRLPSIYEYGSQGGEWIEEYNNTPHSALRGRTPNDVWAEGLEQCPLITPAAAVVRPRVTRRAKNMMVRLDGRMYRDPALAAYNPAKVIVEYDLHDDSTVAVRDEQGRLICHAQLIQREPFLSASRVTDLKRQREENRIKRLEAHADDARIRARGAITAEHSLQALDDFSTPALPAEPQNEEGADELPLIDPLDLSYSDE